MSKTIIYLMGMSLLVLGLVMGSVKNFFDVVQLIVIIAGVDILTYSIVNQE